MATQHVCSFNKFGHCKFQKKCRKMHINDICESLVCDIKVCNLRHPKVCSFYRDYKFCKFTEYCSFSHNVHHSSNDALEKEVKEIEKNLLLLKEKENNHDIEIKKLEKEIYDKENVIRNIFTKFEEFNERIDFLEKNLKVAEDDKEKIEAKFAALEK